MPLEILISVSEIQFKDFFFSSEKKKWEKALRSLEEIYRGLAARF